MSFTTSPLQRTKYNTNMHTINGNDLLQNTTLISTNDSITDVIPQISVENQIDLISVENQIDLISVENQINEISVENQYNLTSVEDLNNFISVESENVLSSVEQETNKDNKTFLIQWNCNGFYSKIDEIKILKEKYLPYIFCFQESLLRNDQTPNLKEYTAFTFNPNGNSNQRVKGGVAIFAHSDCQAEQIQIPHSDLQIIAIKIKFPIKATICNIYLPPTARIEENDIIAIVQSLPTPRIVGGDLNARNDLWGSESNDIRGNIVERIFVENLEMTPMNDGSQTHISFAYGTYSAIDITFIDPELNVCFDWEVLDDSHHSDHFPILVKSLTIEKELTTRAKWILSEVDWSHFSSLLDLKLWENDQNDRCITDFSQIVIEVANSLIRKSSSVQKRPRVPWWNTEIKNALKARKKAFRKFKKVPSEQNLIDMRKKRAETRFIMKQSKKNSFITKLESIHCHTPIKEIWNFARAMTGKYKSARIPRIKINSDNSTTDPYEIAEIIAEKFAEVSSDLNYSEKFKERKEKADKKPLNLNDTPNNPLNRNFSMSEMEFALQNCKSTTPGPDEIHFKMIKNFSPEAKKELLELYNKIWQEGTFPKEWSESTVIPIPKPGKDPTDPDSMRPISLTNCLCKLFEKMINYRLMWFLETKKALNKNQFGFRSNKSTTDVHAIIESEACKAFKNKEHLVVVSLDMRKAYDRVWRKRVLQQLYKIGVRGNMLNFLSKFCENRRFKVSIGSSLSEWHTQDNGIAQGSILSVTLFLVAINDIANNALNGVLMIGYADDWYLLYSHKSMIQINQALQKSLNKLEKWSNEAGFEFSSNKTKAIHICRTKKTTKVRGKNERVHLNPDLQIFKEKIQVVDEINVLGVIFDRKLNWKAHLQMTKKKANQKVAFLKAITNRKWGVDEKTILMYHEALVLSSLEYGAEVYNSASATALKPLNAIHHQGLRIVTGAFKTSPCESLYSYTGMLSLDDRRKKKIVTFGSRCAANQDHHLYESIISGQQSDVKSCIDSFNSFVQATSTEIPDITPNLPFPVPPWLPEFQVDLDLTVFKKNETLPIVMRSHFYQKLEEYQLHLKLYTDGSKDQTTGAAVVVNDKILTHRMNDESSIYTAEAHAILMALKESHQVPEAKILICSDSLSTLYNLKNTNVKCPIIKQIYKEILELNLRNKNITFLWTPAHVGIRDNERADKAAKEAANKESVDNKEMTMNDFKANYIRNIKQNWNARWLQSSSKLKEFKNSIIRDTAVDGLTRRDQVILARVRIGHSKLSHGFLMDKSPPPTCLPCSSPLTIEHCLFHCTDFAKERQNLKIQRDDLKGERKQLEKIIQFLRSTSLYDKI